MKTLVLYYSYSGHTRAISKELAKKESASIEEIKDLKNTGKLKAYTIGVIKSLSGKPWPIQSLKFNINKYNRIILLAPVWANNPPPSIYAVLELLPKGKSIIIKMVSASGKSGCKKRMEAVIKAKGCTLESFENIKA